ncbi:hypothetical protein DL546_009224 [Coniochaeta pulveracea]|uniref:PB1 domain-containing protein n=1 Tax=Coniochaeta pulveracea TaxID=177199 RepID=A0A420YJU3_9PEZI|nr:hypothetical protein DL546_009224 [Coniochaeta pulveracea]
MIDYAQLGLLFKLYSCEVLFNRGLCYIYLQQKDAGMQDLSYAVKEKVVEDHNVIDEAIREEAQGYTVFSIPVGVVYRPNEAKVRNLKTKDYLGKARLVAASDRANAFTGFAGSEMRKAAKTEIKDDRPADNISFAATNLVKPGLQSRRQQSEPPGNRNVFPPTPPPENDRAPTAVPSRAASVRNGPKPMPPRLNIEKARPNERFERESPQDRMQQGGARPSRAASATPNRGYSQREPPRRRQSAEEDGEGYPDDVYDMYGGSSSTSRSSRGQQGRQRNPPPQYIEEVNEDGSDYDDDGFDEGDFEMVSNLRRTGTNSMSSGSGGGRGMSRRPEIRKVRVKVHAGDVRYIMIGTACEFPDLVDKIRDKFGIRRRFKIKVKDDDVPDGEMITMGDQDDLDMVIMTVKQMARKQRLDTGKMEVWVQEI